MEAKKISKVETTKKYTIEIKTYEDGTSSMNRINDGFNPFELMGLASFISLEIREQIIGRIKPDTVKRIVMVD